MDTNNNYNNDKKYDVKNIYIYMSLAKAEVKCIIGR